MSVARILEKVETEGSAAKGTEKRKPRVWEAIKRIALPSKEGQRSRHLRVSQSGPIYSFAFVDDDDRPVGYSGNADDMADAYPEIIRAISNAFGTIAEENERFQKVKAEREARKGGPVQFVRKTGKTERDRQKKAGNKAS